MQRVKFAVSSFLLLNSGLWADFNSDQEEKKAEENRLEDQRLTRQRVDQKVEEQREEEQREEDARVQRKIDDDRWNRAHQK